MRRASSSPRFGGASEAPANPPGEEACSRLPPPGRLHALAGPAALKAVLKRRIAAIEGRAEALIDVEASTSTPSTVWDFGLADIDAKLPGGLRRGALHEIAPASAADAPSAAAFALALLLRKFWKDSESKVVFDVRQPLVWGVSGHLGGEFGRPYLPALRRLGLARPLFLLEARRESDVLWALEEALRSGGPAAVIGEVRAAPFLAARRLQLTAAEAGVPCLLLALGHQGPSAAETRWRIAARASRADPLDAKAPGAPRWQVELVRARGGRPGCWDVEFDHATHAFHLAAELADGAPGRARAPRANAAGG